MKPNVGKRALRTPDTGELALDLNASPTPYVGRRALRTETVALAEMPEPRQSLEWELFAAESPEDTGALPYALTDDFTGSIPKITDEMLYGPGGSDLSHDTTTALPVARAGKRRAGVPASPSVIKRIPSLPSLVGVAVLAVAGIGAVTSGRSDLVSVAADQIHQASALSGTSATAVVGSARQATLSRSDSRGGDAESTAKEMAVALTKLQAAAQTQSDKRKANQWQLPITRGVYRLTARFGDSGLWANRHTGLDFAAPTGTTIRAVSNGRVTSAQYDGAYGNRTIITLEDGTEQWYCHQSRFGVSVGQTILAGDVIGYVGSTGHVTGPHLHLEVRPGGGDPVDPYSALVAQGLQP